MTLVPPAGQAAQCHRENGALLANGGHDGLDGFNQPEMRQKEAFIMLCLGGVRQDIKEASLILTSF